MLRCFLEKEEVFFQTKTVWLHPVNHRVLKDENQKFSSNRKKKVKRINLSTMSYLFWIACLTVLSQTLDLKNKQMKTQQNPHITFDMAVFEELRTNDFSAHTRKSNIYWLWEKSGPVKKIRI